MSRTSVESSVRGFLICPCTSDRKNTRSPATCFLYFSAPPRPFAQPVGEVTYAHGLTSVQRPGEDARFVQKGDKLNQGDVISTSNRGFAVVSLKDGTKITLRPNTSFSVDKFSHGAGEARNPMMKSFANNRRSPQPFCGLEGLRRQTCR